jgi:hypothetical protein
MRRPSLPATARALQEQLTSIFPTFAEALLVQELEEGGEGTATFHSVMQPFTVYFGAEYVQCSERQIVRLASLINDAVERAGDLENAVATCFLEHLHQIRAEKVLARHLSPAARTRLRA